MEDSQNTANRPQELFLNIPPKRKLILDYNSNSEISLQPVACDNISHAKVQHVEVHKTQVPNTETHNIEVDHNNIHGAEVLHTDIHDTQAQPTEVHSAYNHHSEVRSTETHSNTQTHYIEVHNAQVPHTRVELPDRFKFGRDVQDERTMKNRQEDMDKALQWIRQEIVSAG